jgi:hypothetical protein
LTTGTELYYNRTSATLLQETKTMAKGNKTVYIDLTLYTELQASLVEHGYPRGTLSQIINGSLRRALLELEVTGKIQPIFY